MVLCDTNIFISAFNGRLDTIEKLDKIGFREVALSSITVMELYQGMGNNSGRLPEIKIIVRQIQRKWSRCFRWNQHIISGRFWSTLS